jgi:DNA-binding PadR family transcriptional regulator
MLHILQDEGQLPCEKRVAEGKMRKYCRLNDAGERALDQGREKAIELLDEIWDKPETR